MKFQQSLKGDYFDCISLTHKLDYFIRIYVQLTRNGTLDPSILTSPMAASAGQALMEARPAEEG
jgi:hypothetical protein